MWTYVVSTAVILVSIIIQCVVCKHFDLLILHNNDLHGRFEETSKTSGTCSIDDCVGGFARIAHVVREAREAATKGTGPKVLFLNAGDTYVGTSWFNVHKWNITVNFLNIIHPDVMVRYVKCISLNLLLLVLIYCCLHQLSVIRLLDLVISKYKFVFVLFELLINITGRRSTVSYMPAGDAKYSEFESGQGYGCV